MIMATKEKYLKNSQYSSLVCGRTPFAKAQISGFDSYPQISGKTEFYCTPIGLVVTTEINGLPVEKCKKKYNMYGFYIKNEKRQRFSCRSNEFPPLFCENGYAWSTHMTEKLSPNDIIGKTVIIDSGICEGKEKIAYGEICAV